MPRLHHHPQFNCYECHGCQELIEIPRWATLRVKGRLRRVRLWGQPDNTVLWLEMQELDHAVCAQFQDMAKAADAREDWKESMRRKLVALVRRLLILSLTG